MPHLARLALLATIPAAAGAPAVAQSDLRALTPGQMEEDLFLLTDNLEREHSGLLRYASREEIDEAFSEALFAIEEERSILEFYRVLATLVSSVRCGHTRVQIANPDREAILTRSGALPFEVHLVGERAWVLSVLTDGVPLEPGQEILAIDGIPIAEIRERAFSGLFTDGFGTTGKQRELERRFAQHYALLVDDVTPIREHHLVTVAGVNEPVAVKGISAAQYDQRPSRVESRSLIHVETLGADVGYLSVRAFGDPGGGEPAFPEQLEAAFVKLGDAGVGSLILDLRGNGGGTDQYGALLVSYMTSEPFGYFERIEVTPGYEGRGGIIERDGMRLVTEHSGLQVQQPAPHAFAGDVYILTDGWTFSTAADVATVAHHNKLATFVGEETGGGYDGNTSGVSERFGLPNSGFNVRVPCWMYTTANLGHAYPGRGVLPGHPIRPMIEDTLAARDAELELTLALIRAE